MRSRLESSSWRRVLYLVGALMWLGSIVLGMSVLAKHEATPGVASSAIKQWPQESRLTRNDRGLSLVMFAHPRCPCTRASLTELQNILADQPMSLSSTIAFFQPPGADQNWMNTDQVSMANSIHGVHVVSDIDGSEAKRFGAVTSGQTVVYDQFGNLVFSGGITMSRGHVGDNAGRYAVEKILAGHKTPQSSTSVFGCSMRECKQ